MDESREGSASFWACLHNDELDAASARTETERAGGAAAVRRQANARREATVHSRIGWHRARWPGQQHSHPPAGLVGAWSLLGARGRRRRPQPAMNGVTSRPHHGPPLPRTHGRSMTAPAGTCCSQQPGSPSGNSPSGNSLFCPRPRGPSWPLPPPPSHTYSCGHVSCEGRPARQRPPPERGHGRRHASIAPGFPPSPSPAPPLAPFAGGGAAATAATRHERCAAQAAATAMRSAPPPCVTAGCWPRRRTRPAAAAAPAGPAPVRA